MAIAIARIAHKSNSFALIPTTYDDFVRNESQRSVEPFFANDLSNGPLTAIIENLDLRQQSATILTSISAIPGGPLAEGCLERISSDLDRDLESQDQQIDGMILDLAGAMASYSLIDCESYVLSVVRSRMGSRPICLLIADYTNLSSDAAAVADIVIAYEPQDPESVQKAGTKAVRHIMDVLEADVERVTATTSIPILTARASLSQGAFVGCIELTDPCAITAVTLGYPFADLPHTGGQVIVTCPGDQKSACDLARETAMRLWEHRADLIPLATNVEEAVHDAMDASDGPSVLADLGDSIDIGGPGEGTTILWALLDLGVKNSVIAPIVDATAFDTALATGIGVPMELRIGGRIDRRHGYPIDVEGRVKRIATLAAGSNRNDANKVAIVFEAEARHQGSIDIVITRDRFVLSRPEQLAACGIVPTDKQIIVLKSAAEFRRPFESIASRIIDVVTPGITTPDLGFYEYHQVTRPKYPLDLDMEL